MRSTFVRMIPFAILAAVCTCFGTAAWAAGAQSVKPPVTAFDTPQQAVDALVDAAERFDVPGLTAMFGAANADLIASGEDAQDRQRAKDFVAEAREKTSISVDPKSGGRAFLIIGREDWPFPIPIVKRGAKWSFDARAGREEILFRRVGSNELDAIAICRGFVEAQHEYALQRHDGSRVNQYAQRLISTPGTQNGLAWLNDDGTWGGPVGEKVARAIALGYSGREEPYHGYFFKVLKGQGPAAPLGQMDFLVKDVMIGGFALVAAPAKPGVSGVKTFIVSHDGVVYQKDFGTATLDQLKKMDRFNPDRSWVPVED